MGKGIYTGVGSVARKVKRIYVGVDGVARKVKRVYVGDGNGVARLCWSAGEIVKNGTLSSPGTVYASAENPSYSVFLGGSSIYAYNSSLTKTSKSSSYSYPTRSKGGSIGNYAVFYGGSDSDDNSVAIAAAYDTSLTRTSISSGTDSKYFVGSATIGSYLIFAGGYRYIYHADTNTGNYTYMNGAVAYNSSLTKTNVSNLSSARANPCGGTVGGYALFAGGDNSYNNDLDTTVDAYNSSLTRTTATKLSKGRWIWNSAKVGDYLIFPGGGSSGSDIVEAYNSSLTKMNVATLNPSRYDCAGASLGDYAVFAGGLSSRTVYDNVDLYDESLTRTTSSALASKRKCSHPSKIGNYLLFAGGQNANNYDGSYAIDVYALD